MRVVLRVELGGVLRGGGVDVYICAIICRILCISVYKV